MDFRDFILAQVKPPGYYVRRANGLFPAPFPAGCAQLAEVTRLYHLLGIFLAKVMQDGRLVDLPLSRPLLKLMCSKKFATPRQQSASPVPMDITNVLDLADLEQVHPVKARFLSHLSELATRKRQIQQTNDDPSAKRQRLDALTLSINGQQCTLADLALTFQLNPTSKVYAWSAHDLHPSGAELDVSVDTVDDYIAACLDFYTNVGIRAQMQALRDGFDRVFPVESLQIFTADELMVCLCAPF